MRFLITRPYYDPATHYLFYWSKCFIDEARSRGVQIFDLKKKNANRKKVESYSRKQAPNITIFNGHGNDCCVQGQDNQVLVSAVENAHLLEGKKVYIRACNTGEVLGPEAMRQGASAFIGYKKPFRFWKDNNKMAHPLNDEFAKPFMECSNQVGLCFLKGHSAIEAQRRSLELYSKKIAEMLTSESANIFMLADLRANMRNQVCYF